MSTLDFKTQIKNIRKEAIKLGYAVKTMNGYDYIWNSFIAWKGEENFTYSEVDYTLFLLEHYNFDVNAYTNKSKSRNQQLMRSKRILDDFDKYKQRKSKEMFSNSLYNDYPLEWDITINKYLNYIKDVRQNSNRTIRLKKMYLVRELSYFNKMGIKNLNEFSTNYLNTYINETINAGNISKRRNFYVLREFLLFLFIEDVLDRDLSIYIPKIKNIKRRKIPVYIKKDKIEEFLDIIPKEKSVDKRNYAIILIAARLGLRISDILNIKLKDIDWKNYKLTIFQEKNHNINSLPLSKEVGWAIINYIKVRPKCNTEYLFVKFKYPFEKMNQFNGFNKYFNKTDIEIEDNNKKGIHNLRHSLAKNMLDNDTPLDIIASTLGDTNETVSNAYLKIDNKNLKKCTLEVD